MKAHRFAETDCWSINIKNSQSHQVELKFFERDFKRLGQYISSNSFSSFLFFAYYKPVKATNSWFHFFYLKMPDDFLLVRFNRDVRMQLRVL